MKISNENININTEMTGVRKVSESSADFDNYRHEVLNDKSNKEDASKKTLELKEKIRVGEYDIDINKLSSILIKNL